MLKVVEWRSSKDAESNFRSENRGVEIKDLG